MQNPRIHLVDEEGCDDIDKMSVKAAVVLFSLGHS